MKMISTLIAGSALALMGSAALAKGPTGEERLAKLIAGRTAGQPTRCISAFRSDALQVLDRVGVVYDAGNTVWVARVTEPEDLRDRDILIVERMGGSQLCRDDIRRTVDRTDGFTRSVLFFDDFVPYRRG